MLIEADASGLEVVAAAYLSQDPVLMKEIRDGIDIHSVNQERFKLPDRTIAKIFKFRLIYGGSCWSYANDKQFNWINSTPKYWQRIIDEYYEKYQGLRQWHDSLMDTVARTNQLVMPTGRVYTFEPYWKRDQWVWPRTTILNYPVQGLGHDLVAIARVSAYKRLRGKALFIMTVHDSIILDIDIDKNKYLCYNVCEELKKVFNDIPKNFKRLFGCEFNLPMKAEIKYGPTWAHMKKWNGES